LVAAIPIECGLFHGKYRYECSSLVWFRTRLGAKVVIEQWRRHSQVRSHSNIGFARSSWVKRSRHDREEDKICKPMLWMIELPGAATVVRSGRAPALSERRLAGGAKGKEHAMAEINKSVITVIGIDIGKNSLHVVGLGGRGAVALRQRWSRDQVEARLANMPPCLIGMEACVGAHHLSRRLRGLGHDARLMSAKYVRPYAKGQKNDFRDAEAIAEAVQRPTMKFVATKTPDQLDLQALHRVRERLIRQRTGIINQIRAFLLERGLAVRQGTIPHAVRVGPWA
jgi:hypothetical protein